jgi:DHA1 family bicyclomycin/chloramphenicol resistance-like MFS transporter
MNLTLLPFLLMFALINSCIELEISAPSFPDVVRALQTSEINVGLTITYNLVGFCIAALVYGPLSECYGRRRIMLVGNSILALGATGCVLVSSIEGLLLARFIQGFGAATSAVVVSAIIADVYKVDQAAKLYGLMNAIFTTLMTIAPVMGGIINSTIGWRGNYGVVALICIVSLIALYFFLKETKPFRGGIRLKKILFDYKKLFSNPFFLSAAAVPSLQYGCYMAFVAIAPFIYQEVFELPMFSYILHQGAIIFAFAMTSALSGKITAIMGIKKTLIAAFYLSLMGSMMMFFSRNSFILTASMGLFSIGFALAYPIIFAHSLEIFPDLKGTASSAVMGLRYLLCSVITGLASYFYDSKPLTLAIIIFSVMVVIILLVLKILPLNSNKPSIDGS